MKKAPLPGRQKKRPGRGAGRSEEETSLPSDRFAVQRALGRRGRAAGPLPWGFQGSPGWLPMKVVERRRPPCG